MSDIDMMPPHTRPQQGDSLRYKKFLSRIRSQQVKHELGLYWAFIRGNYCIGLLYEEEHESKGKLKPNNSS